MGSKTSKAVDVEAEQPQEPQGPTPRRTSKSSKAVVVEAQTEQVPTPRRTSRTSKAVDETEAAGVEVQGSTQEYPETEVTVSAVLAKTEGTPVKKRGRPPKAAKEGLAEKHQIRADEIDSNLALKEANTDETSQDENVKITGKYTRQWTVDTTNTTPLRKSRRTSATSTDSADSISPVRRIKRKSQIVASKEGTIVLEGKNPETPSKRRGRPPKSATETKDQPSENNVTPPKIKKILESPLRRSTRRLSQSEDEESSNSPLKSAKNSAKKSVRIISDTSSAESESDDVFLKSARKRKLSERAPKLQIIPEVADEDQSAESPKKSSRKSVSATAVMQKIIEETPSKRRGRPPKNLQLDESEPKGKGTPREKSVSMSTVSPPKSPSKVAGKDTPRRKSVSTSAVSPPKTSSKVAFSDDSPRKRGRPTKTAQDSVTEAKSAKKKSREIPSMTTIVEDVAISESPSGSGKTSRRKSVSASAVPQKTDESRLTRSRSQSTSAKVLDVMFTPVKVKSTSRKKETEKLEESRLSKRYAVNPARKSYKIPK